MRDLGEAIDEADVVGVPTILRAELLRGAENRDSRGITAVVDNLETRRKSGHPVKRLVSNFFHTDLYNWKLYDLIFSNVESVSVVSCHDLSPFLNERFGVAVRDHIKISPEHKYTRMFSLDGDPGDRIFPNRYAKILDEIAPEPGEVWLVAAGFLGKPMCNKIKARGGIAIDVGSIVDIWQGFNTRNKVNSELDYDWQTSMIAGLNLGEAACQSMKSAIARHRFRQHHKPGSGQTSPDSNETMHKVRVVGHPRCASAFVAASIQCFGLDLPHEKIGRDGICSWLNAVEEDPNPPWGPALSSDDTYQHTIGYVRDPASALPSIVVENGNTKSFDFRRKHIFLETGIDLADWTRPLDRAIASYVYWMDIVKKRSPLLTLKVENLLDDIYQARDVLVQVGFKLNPENFSSAKNIPKSKNATANKITMTGFKPSLDNMRMAETPDDLRQKLNEFCQEYGYVKLF